MHGGERGEQRSVEGMGDGSGDGTRVVIVGCGFGGIEVASELRKRSGSHDKGLDITLVDRRARFEYQAALPEILSGKVTPEEISADLYSFARRINAEYINAEVVDIDFEDRVVQVQTRTVYRNGINDDGTIGYDYLVLAVGGEQAFFGIHRAEELSHCINTIEGALETREALEDAMAVAREGGGGTVNIAVIGAGLSGVEVAGELAEWIREAHPRVRARVYLVELMPRVLPAFPTPNIASFVTRRLMEKGVKILTGMGVEEVRDRELLLSGEHRLPYDILIWTAGLRPARLLEQLSLPKERGWIRVDPYLRVEGMQDVFAVGDNAYFEYEGLRSGQNVEEAEREGRTAAVNILRAASGYELRRYQPKNTVQNPRAIISLGGGTAVMYLGGKVYTLFAYKLKKFIEHRYMRRFRI